jgi:hypothetical protein
MIKYHVIKLRILVSIQNGRQAPSIEALYHFSALDWHDCSLSQHSTPPLLSSTNRKVDLPLKLALESTRTCKFITHHHHQVLFNLKPTNMALLLIDFSVSFHCPYFNRRQPILHEPHCRDGIRWKTRLAFLCQKKATTPLRNRCRPLLLPGARLHQRSTHTAM